MSRGFPWNRLGIGATSDTAAIRKAYADALRATNVDEDIAGYAELRRARDHALWLAAQAVRAEEEDGEYLGLGDLDDAWDDDAGDLWDDSPTAQHPDPSGPAGPAQAAPELSESQLRAQAAWTVLLGVLYPGDSPSDEAVTLEELDEASAALSTLIARADEADLVEHDALDDGLAELFARTWPRSAPFVEQANAAFGWLDEAGALEERPALVFLNQRLKGMRFHDKVQQPDHPLHKAWAELSRPGKARVLDRLRVKRLEVHKLLTGIRERYPELESHLDPERVASWEKGGGAEGDSGWFTPPMIRRLMVAGLILIVLTRVVGFLSDSNGEPDRSVQAEAFAQLEAAQADLAAAAVFGAGTDMAAVRRADPAFADQLKVMMGRVTDTDEAALAFARSRAHASGAVGDFDALVVRADLRDLWMRAALATSVDACRTVMVGDFRSAPPPLDDKQRAREQALLKQLLAAKVLGVQPEGGEFRYAIPGWLVAETLKRSGLGEEKLVAALTDPAHPDRCKVESALIEAVRAAPGKVPLDVLKGV